MQLDALTPAFPPEAVHMIKDRESGLDGCIVLHSSRLGPAAGGCRLWTYPDSGTATQDALRLAEGMAYKNAMAGLPLGGGKAVLRMPKGRFDRVALFTAFGRAVEEMGGAYVTAEDVGTSVSDMQQVRRQTRHVAGLAPRADQPGGDPSPWTALGVFVAMQETVERRFGSDLRGLTVAVQGLGHVGTELCALLHAAGARLVVAEPRSDHAAALASRYEAKVVGTDAILRTECEVFAPCALGAVLDSRTVPQLRAKIVCGAANNVLATPADGDALAERGVLYAPDFVVNGGGIINVCAEYLGWSLEDVERRVRNTGTRLAAVLNEAERDQCPPHRAAEAIAKRRLAGSSSECRTQAA